MALYTTQEALDYHAQGHPGKLEVIACKSCRDQKDLCLAYSPGVADVCRAIQADPELAYSYTGRGNLVGVVSNGTAVLGLGNIGPLAGKPVMEGKGVLFKSFADVDCYDINLDVSDPDKFCEIVKAMEPTFGGINLEDIKAPECFYIEERLKAEMDIPVFHDDQHGTAIISAAGLLNALELTGKKIENLRVVINGAGAAATACARLYVSMGVDPDNLAMFDSRGHINKSRQGLSREKSTFATSKAYASLTEALRGADMFLGLSVAGALTPDMLQDMASQPVIFACANPDPEISYPQAMEARPDAIMGTGRSDFPNQINNVSGFPFIFRGALDVRAKAINEEMKLAAARAIAALAKKPAPEEVLQAYQVKELRFGQNYVLPKPLDPRLISEVAAAVAEAAIKSGVARKPLPCPDLESYKQSLRERLAAAQARAERLVESY
ncbi:MAG: malate dehydrogenase [Deltaproteobacteria bacterium]|jgi:malate dehydrogenase (oxaloacetate-decarboxylating)(NADP+)|nr:malate dehydrogenase [Deltaproteobacteria bacterium]